MRLLWVDDLSQDDGYAELRHMMDKLAHDDDLNLTLGLTQNELDVCIDADQFLKTARDNEYDLVVIDYKIPPTAGIEVARQMLAQVGNVRIVFLSEWVVQFDPRQKLDPRAVYAIAEKPDGSLDGEEWYRDVLCSTARNVLERPMVDFEPPVISDEARSLFPSSPSQFDQLSFEEQMELQANALQMVDDYLESLFEHSAAAWVILTWPSLVIGYWGRIDDTFRSEGDRVDLENAYGSVSLLASRPLEVGEIGTSWSECLESGALETGGKDIYPSLGVEIEGWRVYINVDTGSVSSFLSREDMIAGGLESVIPRRSRFAWQPEKIVLGPQRKREVVWSSIFDRKVDVDSSDGTVPIRLRARILEHFRRTGLTRSCKVGACHRSVPRDDRVGDSYWCGHRKGLIGRDILRLNPLRLVIDSLQKRCYVLMGDDTDLTVLAEYPSAPVSDRFMTYRGD